MRLARIDVITSVDPHRIVVNIDLHPSLPESLGDQLARAVSAAISGTVEPDTEPRPIEATS